MTSEIHCEDCLEASRRIAHNSVDAIVTDPPYGLKFMDRNWDHGVPGALFWSEFLRLAKPGAHLIAFGGTRTHHRLMCAIEDAGWEIRDCLMWVYGSGFPKSHNLKEEWSGWGTALKPAWEPVVLARRALVGTVAENVLKWGTGALNIDGCRVGTNDRLVHGGPMRVMSGDKRVGAALGMFQDGTPNTFKQNSLGRWPANVIHDGSDEVLELFPIMGKSVGGRVVNISKTSQIYGGGKGLGQDLSTDDVRGNPGYNDSGSVARFFYCAKASKQERDDGCEELEERKAPKFDGGDFVNLEWDSNSKQTLRRNHHPTVKPLALMRYLCRLVTPPGGIVLDPFMGSGSTGKAALAEGFRFIGIEKEPEYFKIAESRILR